MSDPASHPSPPRRLVHLLDPCEGGEDAVLACRATLEHRGFEQHVWLLGDSADEAFAASAGVVTTDRLSIGAGATYRGATTLARLHARRASSWGLPAAAVICWSARAARLAQAEMWDVPRRVLVLTTGPGPESDSRVHLVRAMIEARSPAWSVATLGAGQHALWSSALGIRGEAPGDGLPLMPAHAPPPHAPPATAASGLHALPLPCPLALDAGQWAEDRARVRAHVGVREGEGLLMLLADPPGSGDAQRMVTMGGMIFHAGTPLLCAASRSSFQMARACRYAVTHHRSWEIVPLDGPLCRALPAADVVMWEIDEVRARALPGKPSGGSVLAALAGSMGVPVVAPDHPLSREVLGAAAGSCLARGTDHPDYAHKLLPLLDQAERRATARAALTGDLRRRDGRAFAEALLRLAGRGATPRPGVSGVDGPRPDVAAEPPPCGSPS